jgi:hypothetical protein
MKQVFSETKHRRFKTPVYGVKILAAALSIFIGEVRELRWLVEKSFKQANNHEPTVSDQGNAV